MKVYLVIEWENKKRKRPFRIHAVHSNFMFAIRHSFGIAGKYHCGDTKSISVLTKTVRG